MLAATLRAVLPTPQRLALPPGTSKSRPKVSSAARIADGRLLDVLTAPLGSGILSLPRESDGDGPEKPERISRRMAAKRLFFVRKDHLHKIVGMIRLLMGEALRMPSRAAVTY